MGKKRTLKYQEGTVRHDEESPSVKIIKAFLDNAAVDQVYSTKDLRSELSLTRNTLNHRLVDLPPGYRYRDGNRYMYGNQETVRLKEEGAYDGETT